MLLLFLLLIATIGLVVLYNTIQLTYWKRRGIPHEKPHFWYGDLKTWKTEHTLDEIIDPIYKKYKETGPYCGMYFMQRPTILALDLDFIRDVLIKDFPTFYERGSFHNERDDPLTGHLFRIGGKGWKPLRQKLSPTFTSGKMKHMFHTVYEVGLQFKNFCREQLEENGNKPQIWEVANLMSRFTADVIGVCAFGIDCDCLRNPDAEFVAIGKKAFYLTYHGKILNTFMETFPDLARKLRMRQIHPEIHNFYFQIVTATVEQRLKSGIRKNDFIDMLIEMFQKNELTFEQVVAQSFVFFIAGFDTSSSTMSFALYELAKNQDIQNKLRDEINEVFEQHNKVFSYECMKDLHYLDQVVSETLRMYPIVASVTRRSTEFYRTKNPHYNIEKGTIIVVPIKSIHHDPEIYPNPEVFDPDRFLPEEVQKRVSCSWLPFGDGPRNCIGMRFGQMQASIGLFFMIKYFKFSVCEKTEIPLRLQKRNFLLCPENGIYLRAERI